MQNDAPWMSPGRDRQAGLRGRLHARRGCRRAPRRAPPRRRGAGGPGYARKDHSLASITDRIVGEFDAANRDAVGGDSPLC